MNSVMWLHTSLNPSVLSLTVEVEWRRHSQIWMGFHPIPPTTTPPLCRIINYHPESVVLTVLWRWRTNFPTPWLDLLHPCSCVCFQFLCSSWSEGNKPKRNTHQRVTLPSCNDTNYIVLQSQEHPTLKFNHVSSANLCKSKTAVSLWLHFF